MTPLHMYAMRNLECAGVVLLNVRHNSEGKGEHVLLNLCSPNISFTRRAA
jgi:hypothetical protein